MQVISESLRGCTLKCTRGDSLPPGVSIPSKTGSWSFCPKPWLSSSHAWRILPRIPRRAGALRHHCIPMPILAAVPSAVDRVCSSAGTAADLREVCRTNCTTTLHPRIAFCGHLPEHYTRWQCQFMSVRARSPHLFLWGLRSARSFLLRDRLYSCADSPARARPLLFHTPLSRRRFPRCRRQ